MYIIKQPPQDHIVHIYSPSYSSQIGITFSEVYKNCNLGY